MDSEKGYNTPAISDVSHFSSRPSLKEFEASASVMNGDPVEADKDTEKDRRVSLHESSPPPVPQPQPLGPADKGRTAYLTGFGAFLAHFAAYGQLTSFGIFQKYYLEHQLAGRAPSELAWIGSIGFWLFFFSGGFVGRLFDAHGPSPLIAIGGSIIVFSDMMTSLSDKYYQFILCQGVLLGAGSGIVFNACMGAVATQFVKHRAAAIGISAAGGSVGGVIFPILCSHLLPLIGFPWTIRIIGFISLLFLSTSYLTVRSRLPKRKAGPWIHAASFTDTNYMLFCIAASIGCLGLFTPFFFFSAFASHIGLSRELAFAATAVLNGGAVMGRILPSLVADRVGRFNTFIVAGVLTSIVTLALWTTVNNVVGMMFLAALYGFFSGAVVSLVGPCVAQISTLDVIGQRLGVFYGFCSLSALVGSPIGGAIVTHEHGKYTGLAIFSGITLLSNTVFVLAAKFRMNPKLLARV